MPRKLGTPPSTLVHVKVRCTPEMRQEIDHIAEISGYTRSDVIRACLKKALPGVRSVVEAQLKESPAKQG